jgi:putative transposase
MARPIRIAYEDASYHIHARGNEKRRIFYSDIDRLLFLKTLGEMIKAYDVLLHLYALMHNHYHLVMTTPYANLSEAMGWLQTTYAARFNRRHDRVGHLFQGRFKAHLIEADEYAQHVIYYGHLNCVRPSDKRAPIPLERWEDLNAYRWSSHSAYAGLTAPPDWLNLDWLSYWGTSAKIAQANYTNDIRRCFGKPPWLLEDHAKHGLLVGSDDFCQAVRPYIESKDGDEELQWSTREHLEDIRLRISQIINQVMDVRLKIWLRICVGREPKSVVARAYRYKSSSSMNYVIRTVAGDLQLRNEAVLLQHVVTRS